MNERAYGRRIEIALVGAVTIHAAAFLLAPPYVAKPYHLHATPLRLVRAGMPRVENASTAVPAPAVVPTNVPRAAMVVTEQLQAESPTTNVARGASGAGSSTGASEREETSVSGDDGPPVFYAFDSPPTVATRVEPEYPVAARLHHEEGTVILNANVDATGRVMRVWVARATASEALIESAVDALYRFRFAPGSQQGIPVPCTVAVPFHFHLDVHVETTEGRS